MSSHTNMNFAAPLVNSCDISALLQSQLSQASICKVTRISANSLMLVLIGY